MSSSDSIQRLDWPARVFLAVGPTVLLALFSGCVIVTIVAGPSTVTTGTVVTYTLDLSATGGNAEELFISADVPPGWTLLSNQYTGTVQGKPVSGAADTAASSPCDGWQEQPDSQRIRLSEVLPEYTLETDRGQIDLQFQVDDQPEGEYKIVFWFGAKGSGKPKCGEPAIRTINRDSQYLGILESFTDGAEGVDGLDGADSVTLAPEGDLVVVAGTDDASLSVFQRDDSTGLLTFLEVEALPIPRTGVLKGTGSYPPLENRVAFTPDGDHVYVSRPAAELLAVYARVPGGLDFVIAYDPSTIPDLSVLVDIAVLDEHVYALAEELVCFLDRDSSTGELTFVGSTEIVAVGEPMYGFRMATNLDGSMVFVAGLGVGYLTSFARDSATGILTALDTQNFASGRLWVSPDGRHLYVAFPVDTFDGSLQIVDIDKVTGELTLSDELNLYDVGFGENEAHGLAFSADGSLAVIRTNNGLFVARRDRSSGQLRIVSSDFAAELPNLNLAGGSAVALSPDGRHVYTTANLDDSISTFSNQIEVFSDGFESGDTTAWSFTED